jgi:hypothetical protein
MKHAAHLLVLLSPFAVLACSAPPADGGKSGHAALSNAADDDAGAPLDEDLQYFKDNGFGAIVYAIACVSKTDNGPDVTGDTLPVGAGRWLECTTGPRVSVSTMEVMSSQNEPWCVLGSLATYTATGDPRLVVAVASSPSDGAWTLKATHDGDSIDITPIPGPFGATAWPIWMTATYATTQMQPAGSAASCDAAFGL